MSEELRLVLQKMEEMNTELGTVLQKMEEMHTELRTELKTDIAELRTELKTDITESEERTKKYVDDRIADSERLLLDEMERIWDRNSMIDNRVSKLELSYQYHNQLQKVDSERTDILVKAMEDVISRVEKLERQHKA